MPEILETTMLICFGCSWPLSVIKNIKAKTAKNMSVQFILLIITGYVAGITAKILNNKINYVLVVYVINLIAVSINLVVYFINRSLDKKKEGLLTMEGENAMSNEVSRDDALNERFTMMNKVAEKRGICFIGSDYANSLPISELANMFMIDENICNRSIDGMKIDEMTPYVLKNVDELIPEKVFLNIGDHDLKEATLDIDAFIEKYEWLLYSIHNISSAKLYIISVLKDSVVGRRVNSRLKELSLQYGCTYIDETEIMGSAKKDLLFFEKLRMYLRTEPISYSDAMNTIIIEDRVPEESREEVKITSKNTLKAKGKRSTVTA